MRNHLYFRSDLADDGVWTDDGRSVVTPPGLQHSQLLASYLSKRVTFRAPPWNEEDFGWEFLTITQGITSGVLISAYEQGWLVIVIPATLVGFLRRKRIRAVVDSLAEMIESFLRADVRFSDVRRYRAAEFDAQARATTRPI